jgi:glucose-6-phosphate isomerase
MESNGKGVTMDGKFLPIPAGPIVFGEPGTDGQHSFYQLLHQGRESACEFIGVIKNHATDREQHIEFMSNFFAQPDALACGKTIEELKQSNVPEELLNHKYFTGNRVSTSILFPEMNAYRLG